MQKVLREEIVNPLRKNQFVRADRVMKLRHLLDKLSSVTGLTSEEKDPEEFINSLLAQILRADPFLKVIINSLIRQRGTLIAFLISIAVEFWLGCFLLPTICRKR